MHDNSVEPSNVKLRELKSCDIYRDGGSLEGIWSTSENDEWIVCLKIDGMWDTPKDFDNRKFKLYNCRINEIRGCKPIEKNSLACQKINIMIDQWMVDNKLILEDLRQKEETQNLDEDLPEENFLRTFELITALRKGNF